jgi:hypothetical protein
MDTETGAAGFLNRIVPIQESRNRMDSELRTALAALDETMTSGFARMDRYFQIQHKWMQAWLDELRHETELRRRTGALSERVERVEQEVDPTRGYITREIAEIRLELFELRYEAWQIDYLSRKLAALAERVDRLDPRRQD